MTGLQKYLKRSTTSLVHFRSGFGEDEVDTSLIADWRFAQDKNLRDRVGRVSITLIRASDGTRFDGASILQTEITDVARFDHIPFDGTSLGLRLEAAITNQAKRSEAMHQSIWVKDDVTVSSGDDITVLGGGLTLNKVVGDGSAFSTIFQEIDQTIAAGGNATLSCFVKEGTGNVGVIRFQDPTSTHKVTLRIEWTNGVPTLTSLQAPADFAFVDSGVIDHGNGVHKIWVSIKNNNAGALTVRAMFSPIWTPSGTNGDHTFFGGAMYEDGVTFPSTYIKTPITATVTRAKDVASASLTLGAHTVVISGRTPLGSPVSGVEQVLWQSDDGTANERTRIIRNSSNEMHGIVTVGGSDTADLNLGTVAGDTDFDVALSVATNDIGGVLDGVAATRDTSAAIPSTTTERPGMDHDSVNQWMGTIASSLRFDRALSDAQMQGLAP